MWIVYALFSAVFAALTSIFAKIGIADVNSNLATAVRTVIVLVMAWGMVFITGKQNDIARLESKSIVFLVISGLMTGFSWLCYYKALQTGPTAKVMALDKTSLVIGALLAFTLLKEPVTLTTLAGILLITAGTLILIL